MRIRWSVRRFFCNNRGCVRRVFAERIDELAPRRAQSTPRFDQTLVRVGLESGGEPGARLSLELGIVTSGDTILRRLRSIHIDGDSSAGKAIGIDDFAFRKGQTYGTIIVDHESGRPIELLDRRDTIAVQSWLSENSVAQWVTRDRAGCYQNAVSSALPDAIQIADRWHLLANARTALVGVLSRHHQQIRIAAQHLAEQAFPTTTPKPPQAITPQAITPVTITPKLNKEEQLSHDRRLRRIVRYEQVLELHQQGKSQRAIGRHLRMSEGTVAKYLLAGCFIERARPVTRSLIDPHVPILRRWWDAGDHDARRLHRRLKAEGFGGGSDIVRRFVAPWRTPEERERLSGPKFANPKSARPRPIIPSVNHLSWLLIDDTIKRDEAESRLVSGVLTTIAPIRHARDSVLAFGAAIRERSRTKLESWKLAAQEEEMPQEIRSFAQGIERDWAEVSAAVDCEYSNGRTEGHVNRLKLIKRKMYGRAKFDLLRIRVLASGP